jgi:hypothetical protein
VEVPTIVTQEPVEQELNQTREVEETAWNEIWESDHDVNNNSDSSSEKSEHETVAQVHKSSAIIKKAEEDHISDTSEDSVLQEIAIPATPRKSIDVILELNEVIAAHEETSDEDDLTSSNTNHEDTVAEKKSPNFEPSVPPPPLSPKASPLPVEPQIIDKKISSSTSKSSNFLPISPQPWSSKAPPIPPEPEVNEKKINSPKPTRETTETSKSLQEELKITLRLRNQKKIDEIENQAINVSEGIAIFGGKTIKSKSEPIAEKNEYTSLKAMRAGKFEDPSFINKLNTILKGQVVVTPSHAEKNPAVPRMMTRQKDVVLISRDDPVEAQPKDDKNELKMHMQQMRNTLSRLLEVRRDSMIPAPSPMPSIPELSTRYSKVRTSSKKAPPPPVHKTLDALATDVQIVAL